MAIKLSEVFEFINKRAAEQQDPGAQAMAAAAQAATPPGGIPLPKPIEQPSEEGGENMVPEEKLQAEKEKLEAQRRAELEKKENEIRGLQHELDLERVERQKAIAENELKEKSRQQEEQFKQEREKLDAERQKLEQDKALQSNTQQAELIKHQADMERETSKQVADIAQQKAKAIEDIAKQNAQQYIKTTQQSQQQTNRYFAEQQKKFKSENPTMSTALQNQIGNAVSAAKSVANHHRKIASFIPIPGFIPMEKKALDSSFGGGGYDDSNNVTSSNSDSQHDSDTDQSGFIDTGSSGHRSGLDSFGPPSSQQPTTSTVTATVPQPQSRPTSITLTDPQSQPSNGTWTDFRIHTPVSNTIGWQHIGTQPSLGGAPIAAQDDMTGSFYMTPNFNSTNTYASDFRLGQGISSGGGTWNDQIARASNPAVFGLASTVGPSPQTITENFTRVQQGNSNNMYQPTSDLAEHMKLREKYKYTNPLVNQAQQYSVDRRAAMLANTYYMMKLLKLQNQLGSYETNEEADARSQNLHAEEVAVKANLANLQKFIKENPEAAFGEVEQALADLDAEVQELKKSKNLSYEDKLALARYDVLTKKQQAHVGKSSYRDVYRIVKERNDYLHNQRDQLDQETEEIQEELHSLLGKVDENSKKRFSELTRALGEKQNQRKEITRMIDAVPAWKEGLLENERSGRTVKEMSRLDFLKNGGSVIAPDMDDTLALGDRDDYFKKLHDETYLHHMMGDNAVSDATQAVGDFLSKGVERYGFGSVATALGGVTEGVGNLFGDKHSDDKNWLQRFGSDMVDQGLDMMRNGDGESVYGILRDAYHLARNASGSPLGVVESVRRAAEGSNPNNTFGAMHPRMMYGVTARNFHNTSELNDIINKYGLNEKDAEAIRSDLAVSDSPYWDAAKSLGMDAIDIGSFFIPGGLVTTTGKGAMRAGAAGAKLGMAGAKAIGRSAAAARLARITHADKIAAKMLAAMAKAKPAIDKVKPVFSKPITLARDAAKDMYRVADHWAIDIPDQVFRTSLPDINLRPFVDDGLGERTSHQVLNVMGENNLLQFTRGENGRLSVAPRLIDPRKRDTDPPVILRAGVFDRLKPETLDAIRQKIKDLLKQQGKDLSRMDYVSFTEDAVNRAINAKNQEGTTGGQYTTSNNTPELEGEFRDGVFYPRVPATLQGIPTDSNGRPGIYRDDVFVPGEYRDGEFVPDDETMSASELFNFLTGAGQMQKSGSADDIYRRTARGRNMGWGSSQLFSPYYNYDKYRQNWVMQKLESFAPWIKLLTGGAVDLDPDMSSLARKPKDPIDPVHAAGVLLNPQNDPTLRPRSGPVSNAYANLRGTLRQKSGYGDPTRTTIPSADSNLYSQPKVN